MRFSALECYFPSTPRLASELVVLRKANFLAFSTDFRQFEQYLNITGLDVRCTASPSHTSIMFIFDPRWLLLATATYTTRARYDLRTGLWFLDTDNILKDLVENIQAGVAQVGHLRLLCDTTEYP